MPLHPSHSSESSKALKVTGLSLAFTLFIVAWPPSELSTGLANYLPLHILLETLAIVAALHIFAVVWHTRKEKLPCNLIILGITSLAAGVLDFSHLLSYQGMPVFITPSNPEKAINFWLAARFFNVLGLIMVAWLPWHIPLHILRSWLMLGLTILVLGLLHYLFLFQPQHMPRTFIEGVGLTKFKIISEYLLMLLYLFAASKFLWKLQKPRLFNSSCFFLAAILFAQGEFFFTLYADVTDSYNLAGHLYKIIGFYFLYRAVFIEAVERPYELLHQSNQELDILSHAIEQNPLSILVLDKKLKIQKVNKAFTKVTGYSPEEVINTSPARLHSTNNPSYLAFEVEKCVQAGRPWIGEIIGVNKSQKEYTERVQMFPVQNEQGEVTNYLAIKEDISESKKLVHKLEVLTNHDQLTNLPNRRWLEEYFNRTVKPNHRYALLWLDLDNFREVNDALGFRTGDIILKQIAYRLQSKLTNQEVIARVSGDDFAILFPFKEQSTIALRVRQFLDALSAPLVLQQQTLSLTATVGITIYPEDAKNLNDLLQKAEISKYKAKSQGRNSYQFYELQMQEKAALRLAQSNALKNAIANQELTLVYQPQISLETKRMVGVEALLRWHSQEWGMVSPLEFIPLAESNGLIIPIGEWVLSTALHQLKSWIDAGLEPISMAVNISTIQFEQAELVEQVTKLLAKTQVAPELLDLELTEAVAMKNPELSEQRIEQLHELKVQLSIDDFGTGYSSLSYLKRFKINKLKIDREFIREMENNQDDQAITTAVIQMAQRLSITTLAEGVENQAQLDLLNAYGCQQIQGYYFSKPLAAQDLPAFALQFSG